MVSAWISRTSMQVRSGMQQAAWHSSDAQASAPGEDPFTLSLQSKTEEEVFGLLEKARQQQQQQQEAEEDDDLVDVVNPETGAQERSYGHACRMTILYGCLCRAVQRCSNSRGPSQYSEQQQLIAMHALYMHAIHGTEWMTS